MASNSGETNTIELFSFLKPSTNTSEINGPICRGGRFTTAKTDLPLRLLGLYKSVICADDFLIPISLPKSIHSLIAGFLASLKSALQ